jgi:transposase-like protein
MPKHILQVNQPMFETQLDRMVSEKVTEILNRMLDAEADEITGAARYERSGGRKAYRAGHYGRDLTVKAGKMTVRVPKLKGAVFESAVIERYRRREESVEEALIDMYLAGVSTRRVDDISQALWGERMPSQTLSDRLKKVYVQIDQWRQRPLQQPYPYVFMDGVWHKRSWGGAVENVSVLVAIGVRVDGHREVIGVTEGMKEDATSWRNFITSLIARGLRGVRMVTGDRCAGLVNTVGELLPQARYQRCMVHFMRGRARQGQPTAHPMGRRRAESDLRHGVTRIGVGQGRAGRLRDGGAETQGGRQVPARGH